MKVIIKCDCGNCMEVEPETDGQIAYFNRELEAHNFYIGGQEIDKELLSDTVDDIDDVEAKVKELRIDCRNCGKYMVLDCE